MQFNFQSLGNTGIITGVDYDHDFEVTYPSGNKWTFNPAVLTRVNENNQKDESEDLKDQIEKLNLTNNRRTSLSNKIIPVNGHSSMSSDSASLIFKLNDLVQLSSDIELMKLIQKGHGEWAEAMQPVNRINKIHY
jgi:E3 ubiquitin-protein ligase mind-bomb